MGNCYIFDYEDSFTHNIASELRLLGLDVEVIPYSKIQSFLRAYPKDKKAIFVHGPGPGHPLDHEHLFQDIKTSFDLPQVYHLGLCMGHQIFCSIWGGKVTRSKNPVHGGRAFIKLPSWSVFAGAETRQKIPVQRYNSLSMKQSELKKLSRPEHFQSSSLEGEVYLTQFKNGLTYQFHPESVGTSYRSVFFKPLQEFLL